MTSLVQCVITLKDPSDVFAGMVIIKVDDKNVQVTLQDPLIDTSS